MTNSAATRVLNTNELVESILSHLPPSSINFALARITKSFHSNLLSRPQFLQALFILPDPDVSPPKTLHLKLPGITIRPSRLGDSLSITISRVALGKLAEHEGLRGLLVRQPPVGVEVLKGVKVFHDSKCRCEPSDGWLRETMHAGLEDVLRVGSLVDVVGLMGKRGCRCREATLVVDVV